MENIVIWIKENIWLLLFAGWGMPLGYYRSKFRKIVYRTDSWTINILPYFVKETKALFITMYPDDVSYIKFRNFYRLYLSVYTLLFILWIILK
jgi:thioredoxin-dependent peroxiredoxin